MDQQRSTVLAVAASLVALLLTAPRPSAAVAVLAGAVEGTDPTAPVVAAVALLAWAVAGWLVLAVGVVLLSRVPGLLGRTARALARRLAPATVRRAVEAALGLTVAVGAFAPAAALAAPAPAAPEAAAGAAWDLDWPSRSAEPPAPASSAPASATPVAAAPLPPSPPPSAVVVAAPAPPPPAPAQVVVVRTGDSLWSLAEASLRRAGTATPTDHQVAQAWPRWWAANREAVGDDPDLLLPGTVLRPPPGGAGRA